MSKKRLIDHWRRFRGGPDFDCCESFDIKLENINFSLALPLSNRVLKKTSKIVNCPFEQKDWFRLNVENPPMRQHEHVHIHTVSWIYLPIGLLSSSELGMLSFSIWIKRIPNDEKINAKDLNQLGGYLLREYDDYYNSSIIDSSSYQGTNTKIRKEKEERLREHSKELIQEQTQYALDARGYPPLRPHQIKSINKENWVFYVEHLARNSSNKHYYCFPLNQQYYLVLRFNYDVHVTQKFKLWKKHAEAAEKRIMESVKIESVEPLQIESQK